jgi:voltage-gated potassium channel
VNTHGEEDKPMPTLKQVIEESDTPLGRGFDLFIQSLIILSLIAFSIETLPNLSDSVQYWLRGFEILSVLIFSAEYIVRVYVATPRSRYVFSFFGIVDLAAVLPFYIGTGVDLRSIRSFRLLRLFRIFKLVRYSAAVRRFHVALTIAKEEIVLFLGATLILLYLAAVGIYYFESDAQPEQFGSVFHSLWWAVATLTTVGYGDAYPITVGGRVFTFVILLIGLGVISVPAGLVASALAKARQLEEDGG